MRYQCLEIADSLPPDQALEGVLVFKNEDNTDAFLWNIETGTQVQFPRNEGDRLLAFDVSPDSRWVVYRQASDAGDQTIITASDGQPIWSEAISWYNWFDDERLQGLGVDSEGRFLYLILLNPFTGKRQEIQPSFPNLYLDPHSRYPKWRVKGFAAYDPTLTRAVYPECDPACNERLLRGEPGWPVVLWDIERGQVLARLVTMDSFGRTPIWSSDGQQFIMATDLFPMPSLYTRDPYFHADEFYVVSRDGQIQQLTHFMSYFNESEIAPNYSLSPDGRSVAFWMVTIPSPYDEARLAAVNISTGEVTNYCLKGYPFMEASGLESLLEPIWSPDSTQLLVVSRDPQDNSRRYVILVDLVEGFAAKIAEDMEPVGWMLAP